MNALAISGAANLTFEESTAFTNEPLADDEDLEAVTTHNGQTQLYASTSKSITFPGKIDFDSLIAAGNTRKDEENL